MYDSYPVMKFSKPCVTFLDSNTHTSTVDGLKSDCSKPEKLAKKSRVKNRNRNIVSAASELVEEYLCILACLYEVSLFLDDFWQCWKKNYKCCHNQRECYSD